MADVQKLLGLSSVAITNEINWHRIPLRGPRSMPTSVEAGRLDARAADWQNSAAPRRRRAAGSCIRRSIVEFAQYGLFVAGWTVAFLLGKELQGGFAQWRNRRD